MVGKFISQGSSEAISRGICWSTSSNPTIQDSITVDGSGLGNYSSSITGLNPDTEYFVRAYAINSSGTGYEKQKLLQLSMPQCQKLPGGMLHQ